MASAYNPGDGRSSSTEEIPSDQQNHSENSLSERRSSQQVENGVPSTSPAYSDTDDDDCGMFSSSSHICLCFTLQMLLARSL
jgi:hypothetical protein